MYIRVENGERIIINYLLYFLNTFQNQVTVLILKFLFFLYANY